VGKFVVNLVGTLCVYVNVVCKWVCRGVGLVSASYVFQVWCIGGGCFDACVVPVWWEQRVVQVLLGAPNTSDLKNVQGRYQSNATTHPFTHDVRIYTRSPN